MRTKELKPGVRYATESGTLVETGEEVERGWYRYRRAQANDTEVSFGLPGDEAPAADPWDTRSRNRTTRLPDGTRLFDVVEGVRVTAHVPDRDGNPVEGKSREWVVDPKHIKGTWADYMALHGETVRVRWDRHEAEEAAAEESKRLQALARSAGLEVSHIYVKPAYLVKDRRGDLVEKTYIGRDEVFESYRLVPELEAKGEWVESLIAAWLERGH